MKLLIITGNELRHRFFAKSLALKLEVVGAIFEKKANKHNTFDYSEHDKKIINHHFEGRSNSEESYFSDDKIQNVQIKNTIEVKTGESNSTDIFDWIKTLAPDIILLFGSSLIKDHILDEFPNQVVNLHLGLSPYYRGSGTNFWPLVNKEPECVGGTIHLAVRKVDAGGILSQFRANLDINDTPHDVGNKTILEGIRVLPKVLLQFYNKEFEPYQQDLNIGKICFRKDLTAKSIQLLYQNFENNMIQDYLDEAEIRLQKYPIINQ